MESVNDRDTMEDMITFGQWSLQVFMNEMVTPNVI